MMKTPLLLASALVFSSLSYAESPWMIKLGASAIHTQSNNGTLVGMQATTTDSTQFTPSIEYAFNPNLSMELLLATPFNHTVALNGQTVAKVKELPPTLSLKYNLANISGLKPYAGIGLNYTFFWDEREQGPIVGTKLKAGDSFGLAGLVGAEYQVPNSPFGFALDVRYIDLNSKIKLNGSHIGKLDINPWVFGAGVTYHFR